MKENLQETHFNAIADRYDYWKEKNSYYYDALKALLKELIPPQSRVLEVGCGTGDLLASLSPREGLGIDISKEMVALAEKRHQGRPELAFKRVDLSNEPLSVDHEYLFTCDVLEHVPDLPVFLTRLREAMKPGGTLVVTLANPLWEPLLMLTEKLGMKMPEGPHWRLPIKKNEELFRAAGLTLNKKGFRLLIPKRVPGAEWINARFFTTPLASLGFIVFWVLQREL
jgi:SAM-dependent methyltransferase